ncbi:MAG: TonB-dependent receptor [Cyclobacteriaceae bacterium]
MKRVLFILLITIFPSVTFGQTIKEIFVDVSDNGKVFSEFLKELEDTYSIDFIGDEKKMRALTVMKITQKQRLSEFLNDYLINYKVIRLNDAVTFIIDKALAEKYTLKKENFLLFKGSELARLSLKGTVLDGRSKDPLIGAKIYLPQLKIGAEADINGEFEIFNIQNQILEVDVAYVGYEANHYIIGFSSYGREEKIAAFLFPESRELESVTITAERMDQNVTEKITGVENLSIATIKALPAFLGEIDPIRSLTTLPGVNTVGELASGFNVRGGESGQNLVMQDGATIYNPSHLFGFFSAFNPDMVNNVTLYKGGGPANFGSRIASVLDVSLRNGDAGKHGVSGGVGLVSSRLTFEGPIVRNKSSYLVGGRFSYCNWLIKSTDNISLKNSSANFRDLTARIFHTINENNYLTLSGYYSYDDFKLATDSIFSWSTNNVSVRWDHTFNAKVFSTLTAFSSNYFSEVHSISEIEGFQYRNSIRNLGLKYDVTRNLNEESKLVAGIEANGTLLEPGKLMPDDDVDNIEFQDMNDQRSVETAIYLQNDFQLSTKWSLSAGLRYSYFVRLGEDDIYTFNYDEMNGRYPAIADTISYQRGKVIQKYQGLEPRVSVRYLLDPGTSLKASYYRGYQYLHLISNTSSSTPQDYWVTSGPYLKPQVGDQYSLGIFKNIKENRYELSVEGFYKQIDQAVDYIEGADITLNPSLESGLAQGNGIAYGVEILMKKSVGRMNGWLAYTYSRSLRKFNSENKSITINAGAFYPSVFDQPNHVSLIMNYKVGGRFFLSANFNYSTGRPITIPVSKFSYDTYLSVLNYSARNDFRIPDYHRLDLSLTLKDKPRENKVLRSEWVLSIFNAYGRKNTYSITFTRYGTAQKLSVLGTVFPSLGYNFRF